MEQLYVDYFVGHVVDCYGNEFRECEGQEALLNKIQLKLESILSRIGPYCCLRIVIQTDRSKIPEVDAEMLRDGIHFGGSGIEILCEIAVMFASHLVLKRLKEMEAGNIPVVHTTEGKPVEEGEVLVVAEHKKPPKNSRPMLGPAFDQKP